MTTLGTVFILVSWVGMFRWRLEVLGHHALYLVVDRLLVCWDVVAAVFISAQQLVRLHSGYVSKFIADDSHWWI